MKTGIVLNILEDKAQILLAGGKVTTVPLRAGWQLGDLVILKKRSFYRLWLLIAAGVMVVMGLGFGWMYGQEAAVISLDINPSIELSLNRFHRVISVRAWNVDGEALISGVRLKHQYYTEAVKTLLEKQKQTEDFNEASLIVFTVWTKEQKEETILLLGLQEAASNSHFQETEYFAVDTKLLEQAHASGVSAGKYQYLEELKELDPELDLKAYRNHTIAELKEDIADGRQAAISSPETPMIPEPTPEDLESEENFRPGCGYNKHHQR